MNSALLDALARLEERFRGDDRCLGMYLLGSIGRGETDAYSDVDVAAVVRDQDYAAVKEELRPICVELCGPIAVWLPEGEREGFCNYAFLFRHGDEVLLCDFEILTHRLFVEWKLRPGRVLFDKAGILAAPASDQTPPFAAGAGLARSIDNYWVYAYLNGKYCRRGDLYKMLYVQQTLFQAHLRVLNALVGDADWTWWAGDVKRLSPETQDELLVYFGERSLEGICGALKVELGLFSRDARAACQRWGIAYPEAAEDAVRQHLLAMGVLRRADLVT